MPLKDIVIDPAQEIDLSALSEEEAILRLTLAYRFLAPTVAVTIEEGMAVIMADAGRPEQGRGEERLFERALRSARQGHYSKAIPLFEQALAIAPDQVDIRRNLAMAYLESGQIDEGRTAIIEALRIAPRDAWSNLLMANIFARYEHDFDNGLRWYRRTYEINPHDAILLTNIGAVMQEQQHVDEAIDYFKQAIAADPQYPNSYYGLALTYLDYGNPDLALTCLDDLFEKAKTTDIRLDPVMKESRDLYLQACKNAVLVHRNDIERHLEARKEEVKSKTGYRVEIREDSSIELVTAVSQAAWKYGRDHHLIRYRRKDATIDPAILTHELEHLLLEQAARDAGRNRLFATTAEIRAQAIRSVQDDIYRLQRMGLPEAELTPFINTIVPGLANQLFNIPLDMVIEYNLYQRDEPIRPSQFVSLHDQHVENLRVLNDAHTRQLTPPRIYKASTAMNCAYALFMDSLYGDKTQYAQAYRSSSIFATGQRLFKIWQDMQSAFKPGDEYALVDEFARVLRLQDWYTWRPDTESVLASQDRTEGTTNPELLREKAPASMWYLLDALQKFDRMPLDKVREVAFEIALVGTGGLDYASPEKKYTVRSLPGEQFSGLQLMCFMYVGFKIVAPEQDTGMDLQEPYEMALQLFQSGNSGG